MPRPPRPHYPGAVFHVMARGNAGSLIFESEEEFERFPKLIADIRDACFFRLFAFCLMGNHFHLLIQVLETSISKIMHRLLSIYSKRFNVARSRRGHVFQGRFLSKSVMDDAYLIHLLRYIHLNPVKAGLVDRPEQWPWSGHRELLGRSPRNLVDWQWVLSLFHEDPEIAVELYAQHILRGIGDSTAMEEPDFSFMKSASSPEESSILIKGMDLQMLTAKVSFESGISIEAVRGRGRSRRVSAARRRIIREAFSIGYTITAIAAFLSISQSAASRVLKPR